MTALNTCSLEGVVASSDSGAYSIPVGLSVTRWLERR